jgi:hypothetical protein
MCPITKLSGRSSFWLGINLRAVRHHRCSWMRGDQMVIFFPGRPHPAIINLLQKGSRTLDIGEA